MKKLIYAYAPLIFCVSCIQSVPFENQENIKQLEQNVDRAKQKYDEIAREKEQEIKTAAREVKKVEGIIKDARGDQEAIDRWQPELDKAKRAFENAQAPAQDALREFNEAQQELTQAQSQVQKLMETRPQSASPKIAEQLDIMQRTIQKVPAVANDFIIVELNSLAGKPHAEQIETIQGMIEILQEVDAVLYKDPLDQLRGVLSEIKKFSDPRVGINKNDSFYNKTDTEKTALIIPAASKALAEFKKASVSNNKAEGQIAFKELQGLSVLLERYGSGPEIQEIKNIFNQTIKSFAQDFKKEEPIESSIIQAVQSPDKNVAVIAATPDKVTDAIANRPMSPQEVFNVKNVDQVVQNIQNADRSFAESSAQALEQFGQSIGKNGLVVIAEDSDGLSKVVAAFRQKSGSANLNEQPLMGKQTTEQIKAASLSQMNELSPIDQFVAITKDQAGFASFAPIFDPGDQVVQQVAKERRSMLATLYEPFRKIIKDLGTYLKNLISSKSEKISQAKTVFQKAHANFMNAIGLDPNQEHTADEISKAMDQLVRSPNATHGDRIVAMNKSQEDMLRALKDFKSEKSELTTLINNSVNNTADLIVRVGSIAFEMPESAKDPKAKTKAKAGRYLGLLNEMRDQQIALNKQIQLGLKDFQDEMAKLPIEGNSLGSSALQSISKLATGNLLNNLVELDSKAQDYQSELQIMKSKAQRDLGIK